MSVLLHSESDESSTSESPLQVIEGEEKTGMIPLSGSLLVLKLPELQQNKLSLQIKEVASTRQSEKITIRFQPIGSTPSITPRIARISSDQTVFTLMKFLIKKLQLKNNTVHVYIQNSFLPTPDEVIGDLYLMFKTKNELIIGYCQTIAFG